LPEIHAFDESHDLIASDYLIMQRMPGRPLSEASGIDGRRVLQTVGECLRQVHAITAEAYGYIGEHRPMTAQNSWQDAFVLMWNKLIDDITATGHYSEDEEYRLRKLLDRHLEYFDRPVAACLLHMDVWSQNIMVDDSGTLTGLIDWDRALWGDPEIEFAVLDYCGISEPAFWEGYGQQRDNSRAAQIRGVFYLLYELQKYVAIRHFRGNRPDTARTYKEHAMQLVRQAFGT
jgi:aminoglycoside phosphotransferase (APT) family kinase protein